LLSPGDQETGSSGIYKPGHPEEFPAGCSLRDPGHCILAGYDRGSEVTRPRADQPHQKHHQAVLHAADQPTGGEPTIYRQQLLNTINHKTFFVQFKL